ncbi:MAG: Gfo/Idh/MocA family oxidoreductase [Acidobacteriota bacterium]|nr:Gfo/Idh/MocA family oxidoreductase [Acidobacteriota bacterium]
MIESSAPYRALVCGSNYGRVYLEALAGQERVRPVGLLASGSERSRALAGKHGLPLYRSASELPAGIDLALAALPSSANDVVLELLERGVPVLCEHPRSPTFVQQAFEIAKHVGVAFQINGHFGDLPAARSFAEVFRKQVSVSPPRFLQVTGQERSLYAVLDVLDRAWGGLEALKLREASVDNEREPRSSSSTAWAHLAGTLGEVPIDLRIQVPPVSPPDGSPSYWVDLQLAVGFDTGVLSLLSLAGPVVWNRNLARSAAEDRALWELVGGSSQGIQGPSPSELRRAREEANRAAVGRLVQVLEGADPEPVVTRHRLLALARAWELVGSRLRS